MNVATDENSAIGFTGEERDQESRYFNMGFRQYDPVIGRFLSVDPLFEMFEDLTPYQYSFNNPIGWHDPTGLAPEKEKGKSKDKLLLSGHWETYTIVECNPLSPGVYGKRYVFDSFDASIQDPFGFYGVNMAGCCITRVGIGMGGGSAGKGSISKNDEVSTKDYLPPTEGVDKPVWNGKNGVRAVTKSDQNAISSNKNNHHSYDGDMMRSLMFNNNSPNLFNNDYPDMTAKFNAQLEYTKQFFLNANMKYVLLQLYLPFFTPVNYGLKLAFFASQVKTNAPFDLKNKNFSYAALGNNDYGNYYGIPMKPADFGNYCYGYAARYLGLTIYEALAGAGIYQTYFTKGGGDPTNTIGFGDNWSATLMIIRGYFHPLTIGQY